MAKISSHLWYDKEAKEAAYFYISIFDDAAIISESSLENTPSGKVDIMKIELYGQEFTLLSAGPYFKFNPSLSFTVECSTKEETKALWDKLSKNGSVLMDLGEYPFSPMFGWLQDKFGLSWQLIYADNNPVKQKITPSLMFTGKNVGKAEEAINFYCSVFKNAMKGNVSRREINEGPDKEGTVKHASFNLEGITFFAMDSAYEHGFTFNEAVSFMVNCETQDEIDYYWNKLSADPKSEQCGWLKDKYGLSWQIVPSIMPKLLSGEDKEKTKRVTEAFLKMKKLDIESLKSA